MFKKTKKLDKSDLEELQTRMQMINQYKLVIQALEVQKDRWLVNKYFKYGLDVNSEYTFDLATGKINAVTKPNEEAGSKEGGGV
jgi:hypothetical protein